MSVAHPRTAVRRYAVLKLKNNSDVGGRVFSSRPSPVFLDELPCILVYFADEPATVIGGSELFPRAHQRGLMLNTDVLVEEKIDPDTDPLLNELAEDEADEIAYRIEKAFFNDITFATDLSGYDANTNHEIGLLLGMRLIGTTPYNVDTEGDRRILGQRIQWELPYDTDVQGTKKYDDFNEYYMAIIRVDSTAQTVDRELLEAQGELE